MPDLLIELFSEEIPARMQARARDDLRRMVTDAVVAAGLTYASAGAFSTPRRLTLTVEGLTAESRPVREERKGPATTAPQAAIDGFLRSTGLTLEQLDRRADKKGETFFAVIERPGRPASAIVAEVLDGVIRNFPWPKSMRWGAGGLRWVRPLQSILCLLSDETGASVVPVTVDHLTAGNTTEGHRFMGQGRFAVSGFDDYRAKLLRARVMLDSAERESHIWNDATNAAFAVGGTVVPDAGLLAEVAGLVEWPVVLMGQIGADFLGLPAEVLQTSMREHQKFFSVKNAAGQIDRFITVANIVAADGGATILQGNQKVLSARLSDARFFWENDLRVAKAGMGEWLEGLKAVTFHNKLGSQADRIDRIAALAREIAPLVGADADMAEQAARLAKADLRSAMVGEFPELQGIMGMYYAREAGLPEAVALAARDHYSPLGPSDAVPTDPVSVAVALADKIDTLTGFWAIDEKPTGSKDPFALRRAALGVIRLVVANGVRVRLFDTFDSALGIGARPELELLQQLDYFVAQTENEAHLPGSIYLFLREKGRSFGWSFPIETPADIQLEHHDVEHVFLNRAGWPYSLSNSRLRDLSKRNFLGPHFGFEDDVASDLLSFLHDRLKVFLKDEGIRHDVIDACLAMPNNDDLTLLVKRARALQATLQTDDGANLIAGFKRANNILTQAEQKDGVEYSFGADPKFAESPEEHAIFAALDHAEAQITPAMATEDFTTAMAAMATLRSPIDAFFTATQINVDNPIIRRNRLNLLHRIRHLCGQVADLSKLDG
jgi:glycyl-tRNA synthetase beta chain